MLSKSVKKFIICIQFWYIIRVQNRNVAILFFSWNFFSSFFYLTTTFFLFLMFWWLKKPRRRIKAMYLIWLNIWNLIHWRLTSTFCFLSTTVHSTYSVILIRATSFFFGKYVTGFWWSNVNAIKFINFS